MTHIPFGVGRHCGRGRGTSMAHYSRKDEKDNKIPPTVMDCCYMGADGQEQRRQH